MNNPKFKRNDPKTWVEGDEIEVQGFLHRQPFSVTPGFSEMKLDEHNYVTHFPIVLRATVPEGFNAVLGEVQSIEEALKKTHATYQEAVRKFTQRKNDLLQIGTSHGDTELVESTSDDDILIQAAKPIVDFDDDIPF